MRYLLAVLILSTIASASTKWHQAKVYYDTNQATNEYVVTGTPCFVDERRVDCYPDASGAIEIIQLEDARQYIVPVELRSRLVDASIQHHGAFVVKYLDCKPRNGNPCIKLGSGLIEDKYILDVPLRK